MRPVVALVVALAALALPAMAAAHGRTATVALDYRLRFDASVRAIPGVRVRVLDGDRSLQLQVDPRQTVVVKGLLNESVLRIGPDGVSQASSRRTWTGLLASSSPPVPVPSIST